MKKQEAIELIKERCFIDWDTKHTKFIYVDEVLKIVERIDEPQITTDQAWNKIAESYPETAQSLRSTLDHAVFKNNHAKPIVQPFLAEWYEEWKDDLTQGFYELSISAQPKLSDYYSEMEKLLIEGETDFFDLFEEMKNGYYIDKPKWVVKQKDGLYVENIKKIEGKTHAKTFDSEEEEAVKWADFF